uniref:CR-type domain-containing protein n=1 Tax=Leersia perrieri TaxID=77586 RepID=A0A0D9WBY0_9ORYZ
MAAASTAAVVNAPPVLRRPSMVRTRTSSSRSRRSWRAAAAGEVAAEGNTYLIAGAVAVALVGTAFPILFARKDTCPECDGAGFIRKSGATLRANAARKDQAQIVCPNCNGLGKLGQIDK